MEHKIVDSFTVISLMAEDWPELAGAIEHYEPTPEYLFIRSHGFEDLYPLSADSDCYTKAIDDEFEHENFKRYLQKLAQAHPWASYFQFI